MKKHKLADRFQFANFLKLTFWGNLCRAADSRQLQNQYKCNAKELDRERGLYYYGARYFNPRLSIWYAVDPIAIWNPVMEGGFYGAGQHKPGLTKSFGRSFRAQAKATFGDAKATGWAFIINLIQNQHKKE